MNSVEITTPDGTLRVALRAEALTIGRGATNDVALPYSHISRTHAELRFRQGAWWVIDQGSTNGLHVNGQRVLEARLDPSVTVELSPQVALHLMVDHEPAQPPSPPAPPTLAPPEITPLAAYAPRSPYAEDESPYYPQMRPPSPASHPDPAAPVPPATPAAPARAVRPPGGSLPDASTTAPAQRGANSGSVGAALHICQTCGQRTAPDAVYCQSCHHSIAAECPNCRLSLLPIQAICPRCQTPNPGAVKRRKQRPV